MINIHILNLCTYQKQYFKTEDHKRNAKKKLVDFSHSTEISTLRETHVAGKTQFFTFIRPQPLIPQMRPPFGRGAGFWRAGVYKKREKEFLTSGTRRPLVFRFTISNIMRTKSLPGRSLYERSSAKYVLSMLL